MGAPSDIMNALSVSYVDRMAASDPTRASILISKIAEIWPSIGASWAAEQGLDASSLPSSIPGVWDGITRLIVARALPDGGSAQVRALADQIGSTPVAAQLGPLSRRYLEYIPVGGAARTFAAGIAAQDIGALATGLDMQIAAISAGGTPVSPRAGSVFNPRNLLRFTVPSQSASLQQALQSSGRAPVDLPATVITASPGGIGIPTWGWVVGGLVIATGLGIFAYRKWGPQ